MYLRWYPYFYDAPDSGSGGGTTGQSDVEILEEGSTDGKETEESQEEESDDAEESDADKGSEDADESDDEEESLDEPEDEEEEPKPDDEFTVQSLKKEFPEIFKKFPEVKDAIFRDREYTKLFGSVEDANEAAEKAEILDSIGAQIAQGDSTELVASLKKNESLENFTHSFLPNLFKADKDLYYSVTDDIINRALHAAVEHGNKNGNKNLVTATKYIAQFIFGEPELPTVQNHGPREKSDAEKQLENERQKDYSAKLHEFEGSTHSAAREKLTRIVMEGLDPDNTMSDFTKEALRDKIIERVGQTIAKDRIFQSQLGSLWRRAAKEGLSKEAKSRIISAYLGRAKKIVPSVRAKIRREAGTPNRDNSQNGKRDKTLAPSTSGHSGKRSIPNDPRKIDYSKVSDEDILASD